MSVALDSLRVWQSDEGPIQLHPGDVGWFWRFGADATAAAVRTWSREGRTLAVGLLDEPTVLRLAIAPDALQDEELSARLVDDLGDPARGVLVEGKVAVEAPRGALVRDLLGGAGWQGDEPWTQLRRDLSEPVGQSVLRIEVTTPEEAHVRSAVQRAAFQRSTFTDERWRAMASGPAYADARCLVGHDEQGAAVAAVTVWSAGDGRPGLLEPMGVHSEHRGRGLGRAMTLAAAGVLRELGASSAIVSTPSSNVGAVATYRSAGFDQLAEVRDLSRDTSSGR